MRDLRSPALRLLLLALFGLTVPLAAADDTFDKSLPHIAWKDAAQHYNQRCVVYGEVIATKDIGSRTFINFDRNYRETFTVVINSADYGKFDTPPEAKFRGKTIRVVGEIIEFKDAPEIIVEDPAQIEIVDSAEPPAGTSPEGVASSDSKTEDDDTETADDSKPASHPIPTDGRIKVATFNMFNLFDDFDDPYCETDPTPGKPDAEVKLLAETIRKVNADVVAVEEVENRGVLQHLVDTYLSDMGYREVVLYEGNYWRGVDVGVISRVPVGPVTSYRHISFDCPDGKTISFQRDLIRVNIRPPGHADFDVFVVHLKSKSGGEAKTLPIRMGECAAAHNIFAGILRENPEARFLLCGDFNDTKDSPPLQALLSDGPGKLQSFFNDVPPERQISYNKEPYLSMIDFILASPAMAKCYQKDSYDIEMGTVESSGSDHNPVSCVFQLPPATQAK